MKEINNFYSKNLNFKNKSGLFSFIFGIISIILIFYIWGWTPSHKFPHLFIFFTLNFFILLGIFLGIRGIKFKRKILAIIGIIFCIITLILISYWIIIGFIFYLFLLILIFLFLIFWAIFSICKKHISKDK